MLTLRQEKLLFALKSETTYKSIRYFSNILKVSDRTVYIEIKSLKDMGFDIRTKRRAGIKLFDIKKDIDVKNIEKPDLYIRRIEIIKSLIFDNNILTIQKLSEKYYVSQTSIKNDFEYIQSILSHGNNFKLISDNRGTTIKFNNITEKISVLYNFNNFILENESKLCSNTGIDKFMLLEKYYQDNLVKVAGNIVFSFVKENLEAILDTYVDNFLNIFIAFISALMDGDHFDEEIKILDINNHAFYISSAENILFKSSSRLGFNYNKSDVEYLSQLLINYKFERIPNKEIDDKVIGDLIENIGSILEIDFSKDSQLFERLKIHIPAMIYRLKMNVPANNPFTSQIKLEYPTTFNVLSIIMDQFYKEYNIVFNEDEIAFLTLHFQVSIEKIGNSRKILIVCNSGIVMSQLLVNRIKNIIPSIDELEIASYEEYKSKNTDKYDYILVATDNEINDGENMYRVTPFIKDSDILKILNNKTKNTTKNEKFLDNYLNIYTSSIKKEFKNKEDLLNFSCEYLHDKNFVSKDFKNSVIYREEVGSTEFSNGTALPHGKVDFVNETIVLYVESSRKIKWKDSLVDQVFLIAIAKKDIKKTKKIISRLSKIIDDQDKLNYLKLTGDIDKFMKEEL